MMDGFMSFALVVLVLIGLSMVAALATMFWMLILDTWRKR